MDTFPATPGSGKGEAVQHGNFLLSELWASLCAQG